MAKDFPNILCIRLDSLGDVLMTTPALLALRHHFPKSRLTLLTSPSGGSLASFLPAIDECIVYNAPWMKSFRNADQNTYEAMVAALRQKRYDIAFIFTVYSQNPLPAAMMCMQAHIPERVAYCRENTYELLTHWVKDEEPFAFVRHEVERQLDLVRSYGGEVTEHRMQLNLDRLTLDMTRRKLELLGVPSHQPYFIIHPGATAPSRRYRIDGFIELAKILREYTSLPALITGSPDEMELGNAIQDATAGFIYNAVGKLSTAEFAAAVQRANLVISNNTSTIHIASACATPVVAIYALTNPQHTPWMVSSRTLYEPMPCGFCYRSQCPRGDNACVNRIHPERIAAAALELLHEIERTPIPSPREYPSSVIQLPDGNLNPFSKQVPRPQLDNWQVQTMARQGDDLAS